MNETKDTDANVKTPSQQESGGGLPLDIRTLLLGFWRRRRLVAVSIVVFLALGLIVSSLSYKQVWETETILLYKPPPSPVEGDPYAPPSLTTQMDMIKMQPNLEKVSETLKLSAPLKSIASAQEVTLQKGTTLMSFHVEWDDPKEAADIANTFRYVFITGQVGLRQDEAAKQIVDLKARKERVVKRLTEADAKLLEYTTANQVVDLGKQAQWTLEQLNSIDLLYEQSQIDKQTNELQLKNMERIIGDLKKRVEQEQSDSSSQMESVTVNNVRLQRLREAISDDKLHRSRMAELTEKEIAYQTAQKLHDQGVISDLELAKAKADYEKLKAIAVDTEEIKGLKDQIKELDKVVVPSKQGSASAPILQSLLMKRFELELQSTSLNEKVMHLQEARGKIKEQLDNMPKLERQYVALSRDVSALESEKKSIDDMLARAYRTRESEASGFTVVAEAKPPMMPLKSNRKLIFIAVSALGVIIGLALAVGLELLDTTIKSGGEMKVKLSRTLLGMIPRLPAGEKLYATKETAIIENMKITARRIRRAAPRKGARLMTASATHGEGNTWVGTNLAASLGRQGERVLIVDAQVRMRGDNQCCAIWLCRPKN